MPLCNAEADPIRFSEFDKKNIPDTNSSTPISVYRQSNAGSYLWYLKFFNLIWTPLNLVSCDSTFLVIISPFWQGRLVLSTRKNAPLPSSSLYSLLLTCSSFLRFLLRFLFKIRPCFLSFALFLVTRDWVRGYSASLRGWGYSIMCSMCRRKRFTERYIALRTACRTCTIQFCFLLHCECTIVF